MLTVVAMTGILIIVENGYQYRETIFNNRPVRTIDHQWETPLMYVCLCKGLTESDVREAGRQGCLTTRQIIAEFGLRENGCCGRCAKNIHELVDLAKSQLESACRKPVSS